jgi:purine-binding chemotaxis protein CheW
MDSERTIEASREQPEPDAGWALLTRVGARLCAVPLAHAVETMRLLQVSPLADAPSFVRGLTIIRGVAVPVVDLGALLGEPATAVTRLVLVRVDERPGPSLATRSARLGGLWPGRAVGVRAVEPPTASAEAEADAAPPERCVALAVDGVLGVVHLDARALQATPLLAQSTQSDVLAAVGALDQQLLVVLRASHLLTEETWLKLGLAAQ